MNIGILTTWFERGAAYVSKTYMDVLSEKHDVFIYARGGEKKSKGDSRWDLPNITYGKEYRPLDAKYQLFTRYTKDYVDMLYFGAWLSDNDIYVVIFNEERNVSLLRRTKTCPFFIDHHS